MKIQYKERFQEMLPVLNSKKNEFHMYGYGTIQKEDIRTYCIEKLWRKKDVETLAVHEMVNDILHLSAAAFMTYTQIEAQRDADWFSEINADELQLLLGQKSDE